MMTKESPHKPRIWLFISLLSVLIVGLLVLIFGLTSNSSSTVEEDDLQDAVSYSGKTEATVVKEEAEQVFQKWAGQLEDPLSARDLSILTDYKKQFEHAEKLFKRGEFSQASAAFLEIKKEIIEDSLDEEIIRRYEGLLKEAQGELFSLQEYRELLEPDFQSWLDRVDQAQSDWASAKVDESIASLEGVNMELQEVGDNLDEVMKTALEGVESFYFAQDQKKVNRLLETLRPYAKDFPEIEEWSRRSMKLQAITPLWEKYTDAKAKQEYENGLVELEALLGVDPSFQPAMEAKTELQTILGEGTARELLAQANLAIAEDDLLRAEDLVGKALENGYLLNEVKELQKQIQERQKELAVLDLLDAAFAAYQAQDFIQAKEIYQEVLNADPANEEAKEGYRNSTKLAVASVKFQSALKSAQKLVEEGRYPLAIKFFNRAMQNKPQQLALTAEAKKLEEELLKQSVPVELTIKSDGKTYVSMVGVFPPEKFKSKTVEIVPDLYTIYGKRSGYRDEREKWKIRHGTLETKKIVCTKKL